MTRAGAAMAGLERSARVLAAVKLANVALVMAWGFAVTYVFVRLLPMHEFRAFLLLVAFGNFTVSAELGLTTIVYNRVRRHWLGQRGEATGHQDFRHEEPGVMAVLFLGLMLAGTLIVAAAIAAGVIETARPLLFILFFLTACLNLLAALARRMLAAVDRNLVWDLMDTARRLALLALLGAALLGMNLELSVFLQLAISIAAILVAFAMLHRRLDMRRGHWLAVGAGWGHVRQHYLADFGASAALTLSEVAAYNAPYFLVSLATADPRPLLLFDFLFKISRALTAVVRAMVEAALPRLTAAWYRADAARFGALLRRALIVAMGFAAAIGIGLLLGGRFLVHQLFDGKLIAGPASMAMIALLLVALSITCVSVYLQGALGRFTALLRQSLPFLAGSLLSVPLAAVGAYLGLAAFATLFVGMVTAAYGLTGALHAVSLARLMRAVRAAEAGR
ncbi:hypothetical protein [Sphingobium aquiterrae]|uniref:hypothetical protein n=1 Tax=Sphingobium aquiterrae TaxID=2038656 RepID=UPI003019D675